MSHRGGKGRKQKAATATLAPIPLSPTKKSFNEEPTHQYLSWASLVASGLAYPANQQQRGVIRSNRGRSQNMVYPPYTQFFDKDVSGQRQPLGSLPNSVGSPSRSSSSSSLGSLSVKDKRTLPPPPKQNLMFQESRYKTELCRQYMELGICEYGERCLYAHGQFELKQLPNRHPKFKTERCSAYHDFGYCSFGPRCSFVHGRPTAEDILRKLVDEVPKTPWPQEEEGAIGQQWQDLGNAENNPAEEKRLPVFVKLCPN